ncbi:NAD(P)-dependent oxidoreductase [Marinobacterium sedimentorum]|uniref:NAD(P)-dependent oxidoreductase n=1 Tax=Marinobacterium sedimentorum TaxID=2927804 RepID=UPI0020C67B7B|nr:NAD(P)-binding oxidoreductase [Marinobacterium sedimentorum]MCP8688045.1 SDR family oxidoreductase [Marinobacterium sedimentorum]
MNVLVIGASGATGRLLVAQLLDQGIRVRAIVRSANALPEDIRQHALCSLIEASVHDIDVAEMAQHLQGCDAVALCLGHNLAFKGIFGQPRMLVRDTVRTLCQAIRQNGTAAPVRLILMNTSGNSNRDLAEKTSFGQTCVITLLRLLLPPHLDNERAADYLRTEVGQSDSHIEWAAVRPDRLSDEDQVTQYDLHASPIRDPIFDSGSSSRINVAHLMAELASSDSLWREWKGKMPVIYNSP